MKHKIYYVMAMIAIILAAFAVWNWSFQIAGALHCKSALVDAMSAVILAAAFYPAGKVTEKKEDYA